MATEVAFAAIEHMVRQLDSSPLALDEQERGELVDFFETVWRDAEVTWPADDVKWLGPWSVRGQLELWRGEVDAAERSFLRLLEILDQHRLRPHPSRGIAHGNLASIHLRRGDLDAALEALEKALDNFEATYGAEHFIVAQVHVDLGGALAEKGEIQPAIGHLRRALDIEEASLDGLMLSGSSQDQRALFETQKDTVSAALFLQHQAAGSALEGEARHLALETILQRKGRNLDAAARQARWRRYRKESSDDQALEEMASLRARWSRALLLGHDGVALRRELEHRERRFLSALEDKAPKVTLEKVQDHLPPASTLVEIVTYDPPDLLAHTVEAKRYLAYLLFPDGTSEMVDLGEAAPIHSAIDAFTEAAASREFAVDSVMERGRALDQLTLAKIRPRLRGFTRLILAPDSRWFRIPFAALVDEEGRFLVETLRISQLTTGAELVRRSSREPSRDSTPPLLVAAAETESDLQALPGALDETLSLARLLGIGPDRVLRGSRAKEDQLKKILRPRWLHVAAHGLRYSAANDSAEGVEEIMAHTGIALSDYRGRAAGDPRADGFLDAFEIAELDLEGTELVYLSACGTGRGEVREAQGIYGLRRALVLAGSRSQVTSLWQLDDGAAAHFAGRFYTQLVALVPKDEALRRVQLHMISRHPSSGADRGAERLAPEQSRTVHPYYWASYVLSGESSTPLSPRTGVD